MDDSIALEAPSTEPSQLEPAPALARSIGREIAERSDGAVPGAAGLATAAGGALALGAAVALGTGSVIEALRWTPLLVGPAAGAVVLTTPALLVAHQFLGVNSPVTAVAEALGQAALRVGQIGWGFAPMSLLFAVTAPGAWPLVFGGDALLLGAIGSISAASALLAADRTNARWGASVLGWCALTLLVAMRLLFYSLPVEG